MLNLGMLDWEYKDVRLFHTIAIACLSVAYGSREILGKLKPLSV